MQWPVVRPLALSPTSWVLTRGIGEVSTHDHGACEPWGAWCPEAADSGRWTPAGRADSREAWPLDGPGIPHATTATPVPAPHLPRAPYEHRDARGRENVRSCR